MRALWKELRKSRRKTKNVRNSHWVQWNRDFVGEERIARSRQLRRDRAIRIKQEQERKRIEKLRPVEDPGPFDGFGHPKSSWLGKYYAAYRTRATATPRLAWPDPDTIILRQPDSVSFSHLWNTFVSLVWFFLSTYGMEVRTYGMERTMVRTIRM